MTGRGFIVTSRLFLATLVIGCLAADDGDDFSNNLFSDLAPLLALFGERVTMQFMSQSMGWADNIILAMAPLGIVTAIVAAIRVGGPSWLRAVIGRARENLAISEAELMSSTSKEVCEVWNGQEVVRCMGLAPVVELICLLQYTNDTQSDNEAGPTIEVLKLGEAIEKKYIKDLDSRPEWPFEPGPGSDPRPEPRQDFQQNNSLREPISDEEQANPRLTPVPPYGSQLSSSPANITRSTIKTQKPPTKLKRICIIRDDSDDSPNILLNCHPPAKRWELWGFAAFGTILQLGVLIYSGLATYHPALKFEKDGKLVEHYAYPCTAVGTVVLVFGMLLCSHVVESSTAEKRYQATDEWKTRIVWLQQTKTVSDQVFESCMVYARDDRQTITTSRRIQRNSKAPPQTKDTGARSAGNDDPSAFLQLITISGTVISLCGFVLQFVGLRGMHWSASVAQLGAVLMMIGVKAWVRRGLARSPAYEPLPSGFELDSFAKTLGEVRREPWSGAQSNGIDISAKVKPSEDAQLSKDWVVVTGGDTSLVPVGQSQRGTPSSNHGSIVSAQTVLKARKRLARLSKWRGHASLEAISLARAIECTLNTLTVYDCLPKDLQIVTWNLKACYIKSQPQTISVRLSWQERGWKVDVAELEGILSLWLSSVDGAEPKVNMDTTCAWTLEESNKLSSSKGTASRKSFWVLGEQTPSLARDLQWWIPRDLLDLITLRRNTISMLGMADYQIVGIRQNDERYDKHARLLANFESRNNGFDDDGNDDNNDYGSIRANDDGDKEDISDDRNVNDHRIPADNLVSDSDSGLKGDKNAGELSDENQKSTKFGDESSMLVGAPVYQSLTSLYTLDLYSSFMRAAAKAMTGGIPGEAEDIRINSVAEETSWKIFALRNSHLTKLVQDVHNTGLGSLGQVYLSIVAPLSVESRLPGISAVVNLTLQNAKRHEQSQQWQQAGDDLMWLSRLANKTFPKRSLIAQKAAANLTAYLRLMDQILHWKSAYDSGALRSFEIATEDLKKLCRKLRRELGNTDSTLREEVERKFSLLDPTKTSYERAYAEAESLMVTKNTTQMDPRDILYRTATHYAALSSFTDALERILDSQREINAQDLLGRTAMHYSCLCSDRGSTIIHGLIRHGAELDVKARDGATPLHYAAMTDKVDVVTALVEAGAAVDVSDLTGRSPLQTAAVHGHVLVVQYLWEKAKRDLRDRSSWTVLHLAAMSGHETVVKFLVEAGVDRQIKDRSGRTALQLAAKAGRVSALNVLLREETDLEVKDRSGRTALHLAAEAGQTNVVGWLVRAGAKKEADTGGIYSCRPLALAVENGHEAVVSLLLEHGADLHWTNFSGDNLLHIASGGPSTHLVEKLLDSGLDIESEGGDGRSPLHCAAEHGRVCTGRRLLKRGANIEHADYLERTPLWYAVKSEKTRFVQMLLVEGASTNVTSVRGRDHKTLLERAERGGNETIIGLLQRHIALHPTGASQRTSPNAGASSNTGSHVGPALSSGGLPTSDGI